MLPPRTILSLRRTSWRWFPQLDALHELIRAASAGRPPRLAVRLLLEQLEDYTLPSGSISGSLWNDLNGDGFRQPPELGLAARVVYLDLNGNGQLDTTTATRSATSSAIGPAPGALGGFGGFMSSLQAQGLSGTLENLAVNMDLTNTGKSPVVVAVISPTGLTVPNLPNLFTIGAGEHFVGTFDGNSNNPVAGTPRPLPPGTYAPEQSFVTPLSFIDGTDPNGLWGLVFFGDTSGLNLKSWSLTFTTLEPSTKTDAAGAYSFQGLAPGAYTVRTSLPGADTQTAPAGGAGRAVTVTDGHGAAGINFGVKPAPDLAPVSFSVTAPATGWGQNLTARYTVTNQGDGAAGPFDLDLRLSADGRITTAGPLLQAVHFDGLAAHSSTTGTITVHLPAGPPAGFGDPAAAYVGVLVDSLNRVAEADETNNANLGAGIDLALVNGSNGVGPNVPIVRAGEVQQSPSLAVDPTNPLHLVSAYLDAPASGAYTGLSVSTSTDGGTSWVRTSIPLPAGFDQAAAAPTVAFDAAGGVHISFMGVTFLGDQPTLPNPDSDQRAFGFTANNGVFVVSSSDGGATWGPAVAVASHLYDPATGPVVFETYPSLAADTSRFLADGTTPNPNFGNLYLAWSRFYPAGQFPGHPDSTAGSDVMFAVSRDGGQTWATQTRPTGAYAGRSVILDPHFRDNGTGDAGRGFVTFPTVTVGTGGDVYVSTYAGGNFVVYHSANGGTSFTAPDYDSQTGLVFPTLNGIIVPSPFLQSNAYTGLPGTRTLPLRPIVADPAHPGRVYAVAVNGVTAQVGPQAGQAIDPGDVLFAVSNDFGQTWTSNFTVLKEPPIVDRLTPAQIASYTPVLNDDNAGEPAGLVADLSTQVLSGQALPSLAVDASGNVVVVWYDTREGPFAPNNPNTPISNVVTVWGTVSTDGGKTFSPNFPISDTPFDLINGRFAAGDGSVPTYLGDQIGVVIADGTAYVAWTDAREGRTPLNGPLLRQDIYLGKFSLSPNPSAPADRFGGNNTFATATDLTALGYTVTVPLDLARLVLSPGRSDKWFVMQAGANGPLTATVTGAAPGDLHLVITDENGAVLPATATPVTDATGAVVGTQLTATAAAGGIYFVHAFGTNQNALTFDLSLTNLTADLGPQVQGSVTAAVGGQDVYRLVAGVTGTMTLTLDGDGSQALVVLTPDGVTPLFDGTQTGKATTTLQVTQGQTLLLLVIDLTGAGGTYTLRFANADQYSSAGTTSLFLPTTGTPASLAVADFNGDGKQDLIATSTDLADVTTVFLGNGDGTFQAPRQSAVGAGLRGTLTADNRQPQVLDVNHDGIPDAVVPNFRAADVSVLLGRGDGTFQPQRRFDAVTSPDFTASGDFNADGNPDLVVLQNFPQLGSVSQFSVILGHGDGTFDPPVLYRTAFTNGAGPILAADFTGDGKPDLLVFSKNTPLGQLYRNNGDGTFTDAGTFRTPENAFSVKAVDLDGNGKLDLIFAGTNSGNVYTALGNGDGTFQPAQKYAAMVAGPGDNIGVRDVALIAYDPFNSPLPLQAPPKNVLGQQLDYGNKALVLTAGSRSGQGPAEVILLPELVDPHGEFAGFNTPVPLARVKQAGNLATGDFDGDGKTDVAVVDSGGVTVVYGISGPPVAIPANDTRATARDLGTVVHFVTPALSIVTGHDDAYFKFTVPTEAATGSGDQVIDISALFQYESGPGLRMEVLDASGNVVATGSRVRVAAVQGAELTIHVFGNSAGGTRGSGAYTLDIDVLPQVVSAQAHSFLPGGPATSIVLTLQGDRLDPATAEDPANYTVTWLGPNGETRVIPVGAVGGAQPVVYDPGANVAVSSGLTYPTAVRQTITLLFADPLPAGSYSIALGAGIQAAAFVAGEAGQLAGGAGFAGHPLVSADGGVIRNGATLTAANLVGPSGAPADLSQFAAGTPFLTQLQNDLGALLDTLLRSKGDDPSITPAVMAQILARILPGLDPNTPLLVLWLDPVSLNLADSEGARSVYTESGASVVSGLRNTFVEVGGIVELVVVAGARGTFTLNVGDVGAAARGGAAVIADGAAQTLELTSALRAGTTAFEFTVPGQDPVAPPGGGGGGSTDPGSPTTGTSAGTTSGGTTSTPTATATTVIALLLTGVAGGPDAQAAAAGNASGAGGDTSASGAAGAAATGNGFAGYYVGSIPLQLGSLLNGVFSSSVAWWGRTFQQSVRDLRDGFGDAIGSVVKWLTPARVPAKAIQINDPPQVENQGAGNGPAVAPPPKELAPVGTPTPGEGGPAPGAGQRSDRRADPAPAAAEPEPRRTGTIGAVLAAALASLLGVHITDRRRASRNRAEKRREPDLPRADQ